MPPRYAVTSDIFATDESGSCWHTLAEAIPELDRIATSSTIAAIVDYADNDSPLVVRLSVVIAGYRVVVEADGTTVTARMGTLTAPIERGLFLDALDADDGGQSIREIITDSLAREDIIVMDEGEWTTPESIEDAREWQRHLDALRDPRHYI